MAADKTQRIIVISERIYRCLLFLYPRAFKQRYSHEMAQTFRDCCREALHLHGLAGVMGWWSISIYDLLLSSLVEHVRSTITALKQLLGIKKEHPMLYHPFHLDVALRTDIGIKRASNDDSMISVVP